MPDYLESEVTEEERAAHERKRRLARFNETEYAGLQSDTEEHLYWEDRLAERLYELDSIDPDEVRTHAAPHKKCDEWAARDANDVHAWWESKFSFGPHLPAPIKHEGEHTWGGLNARQWWEVWALRMLAYQITDEAGGYITEAFLHYQSAEALRIDLLKKEGRFAQLIAWATSQEAKEFPPVNPPKPGRNPLAPDDIREVVKP